MDDGGGGASTASERQNILEFFKGNSFDFQNEAQFKTKCAVHKGTTELVPETL